MQRRMTNWQVASAIAATLLLTGTLFAQGRGQNESRHGSQPAHRAASANAHVRGHAPEQASRPPRQVRRSPQEQRQQEVQQRQVWQQHRLKPGVAPRNWGQQGGYRGGQIPTAYFGSHYGYGHKFRVYSLPFQVVSGVPRFQSNGYWFELAGPAPAQWGTNWYQNDDVYIVSAYGGYYLDNARFPNQPGIAISVVF